MLKRKMICLIKSVTLQQLEYFHKKWSVRKSVDIIREFINNGKL